MGKRQGREEGEGVEGLHGDVHEPGRGEEG